MTKLYLKKGEERRIRQGHPWIYDNEIGRISGGYENGDSLSVYDFAGHFLGSGYINDKSRITVRLFSRRDEPFSGEFIKRRLLEAAEYRRKLGFGDTCRLLFGEADRLPGVIVDMYAGTCVLQTLTLAADMHKSDVVSALMEIAGPSGIFERNDDPVRAKEGLAAVKGRIGGTVPEFVRINENGFLFDVDICGGQKTGHFLDQRCNHAFLKGRIEGAEVLDLFCHTGGFAVHAAGYGASRITAADISEPAVMKGKANAELNGFAGRIDFKTANAFDLLREYDKAGRKFDRIVLDPPAFARNRASVAGAIRGYHEINLRALKLLNPGGLLVTCSCSYHVGRDLFSRMILDAARDAHRTLRQIDFRGQAPDHPVLAGYDESAYLKCGIFEALAD